MMKRLLLMMFVLPGAYRVPAQYLLRGSSYEQHFDTLASGLPEGWDVDTNATASAPGGSAAAGFIALPATTTRWSNTSGAFKNVASANSFTSFASATGSLQLAAADRALGIKQTGSFGDPGAAFVFRINNTFRLSDFKLDFRLQSLDAASGSRLTGWKLQYSTGDTLHFTTLGTGMVTGGNTYSNTVISNNFGTALDDQRFPVWIRIIAFNASSGTGTRTTTAIDDVRLTWTGFADTLPRPVVTTLSPLNGATAVPLGSLLHIRFNRNITTGTSGDFRIKDETDNVVQVLTAATGVAAGKELSLTGVIFKPGHSYHITFDSTIADTAGLYTYGFTDTTAWRFRVTDSIPAAALEYFDTACSKGMTLANGWYTVSVAGTPQWHCEEYATGNYAMHMYGHEGSVFTVNEDWLIAPMLDLRGTDISGIMYRLLKKGSGAELQLLVSTDYAGSGAPGAATWSAAPLSIASTAADTGKWVQEQVAAATLKAAPFYLAFKYLATAAAGYDILVDSFMTMAATGTGNIDLPGTSLALATYTEHNKIRLTITAPGYTDYRLQLCNTSGQLLYTHELAIVPGVQTIDLDRPDLPPGLYIIKLTGEHREYFQKCLVR